MPTTPGLPPEAEPQHRCADCGALRPESQMTSIVTPTKGQVWYCADAWWRSLRAASPVEKIEAITGEPMALEPEPDAAKRDPLAAAEPPSPKDELLERDRTRARLARLARRRAAAGPLARR